jgi:CubicO group peptidase (beta-lactamase class C family)
MARPFGSLGVPRTALVAWWLVACGPALCATEGVAVDLEPARQRYAAIVADELQRGIIPGVSIAWVVDGATVHTAGFGLADRTRGVAATPDTIYRVGSISKLFNAVAAMQLVEQGRLDLDAPIQQALPDFSIVVPFPDAGPVTARQLLCHRSGMIREAPVGGYLDDRQPTVAATLASVRDCVLVNPPNSKTRYSNVGPTIVGRAIEVLSGSSFAAYQRQHLLDPLGMSSSAWQMNDALRPRLAQGLMRIARGSGQYVFDEAPHFELGTMPAGNLYATAPDLARFAQFVMGALPDSASTAILQPQSLEKMLTPQLTGEATGFGLGFGVQRYRGHKTAQHMGAVYGFTTSIVVLPQEKIGVIVLSNADIAVAPVRRLSEAALDLLLEAVRGESAPQPTPPVDLSPQALADFVGEYESPSYWAALRVEGSKLVGELSDQPIELTPVGPTRFLADGRIMHRSEIEFSRDDDGRVTSFRAAGQTFRRVAADAPLAAPNAWRALTGHYGLPFIPLIVSLRHGHLYALAENEYDYRLAPLNRVTFCLPAGMYEDEHVVFQIGAGGKASGVVMANMLLPRRPD